MAKVLKIAEIGNPVLRSPALPIQNIQTPAVQTLIDNLLKTVKKKGTAWVSQPRRFSERLQLFIVASRPNLRYLNAPTMEPMAMINPQILAYSDDTEKGWEGCLSVPGMRGLVARSREIKISYSDRYGEQHTQVFTDFVARIIQHEYDHINGKVFLDRVESTLDMMSETEYHARIACA